MHPSHFSFLLVQKLDTKQIFVRVKSHRAVWGQIICGSSLSLATGIFHLKKAALAEMINDLKKEKRNTYMNRVKSTVYCSTWIHDK